MTLTESMLAELNQVLDSADINHQDADTLQTYGRDWTTAYQPNPSAVVFPRSTEQVRDLVVWANRAEVALVPSGGRTGLSGGAVAANGEIVVSFDKMNRILDFDPVDRTVNLEAGVITQQLQEFAQEQGLFYPVDFASAGSSQIGGNIATNAGGIKVIRYGLTRDWVAGLTVVTGQGDILELNQGLVKNATGYDLRHLFIGSEGTLGFITRATMRLQRPPDNLTVLVLGVPEFEALSNVATAFREKLDLTAFEFFSERALERVVAKADLQRPFEESAPFYALLEFEMASDEVEELAMTLFETCMESGWVVDGVMSQNQGQAQNLWRLREDISETIAEFSPYKNDLSVRVSKVPEFLNAVNQVVLQRYPDFEIVWYGHIGDGNLHLNILKPASLEPAEFLSRCAQVNDEIFSLVQRLGGSVSAEHGVGLVKRDYLHFTRSATEISYLRAMKRVFDPKDIMNPGKLL